MNWKNIKKRTVINSCIIALLCVTLFVCALMTTRGKTPEERTNFTSDTECSVDAEEPTETTIVLPETIAALPETTTKAPAETKKDAAVKAVNAKTEIAEEKKECLTEREFTVRNIFVSAVNSSISDTKLKYMRTVVEGLPEQFFSWNVKCIKIVDGIPGYGKNCRGLSVYTENTIYLNSNTPNNAMIRSAIFHEFGHFADASYTGFTLTDRYTRCSEWTDACHREVGKLYEFYPGMNKLPDDDQKAEAFAMVFDAYHTGCITGEKVDIKSMCPEMYQLVFEFVK